ncbi:glycosyltransferase family 4 protein [Acinetobacter johnsonii]|uniref:glycosyltransferase family 4 protein n=1 Tax=Acinetobacter johnsonii TaxID=40214 RepID=UPI00244A670A|nr:glycosyltransferase family 4 protein [Acinetobacter johnsonii]MDH1706020.1 glycosyltransferase family 4 protein [Acinetobacter johnsonii]
MNNTKPAIWFPTIQTNTGTDRFTEQLVTSLNQRGFQAEITWLPHHAEYLPWFVPVPQKPEWANIVHINSWLHPKFYPSHLPIVATVHLCVQDPTYLAYKSLAQKLYHQFWVTPIERKNFTQANIVTAVSQYTATCVESIFGIESTQVVYNGIDTDIFKNQPQITKDKTRPFRLLFVGTNSIRKGFDLLPQIMNKLGDDFELLYTNSSKKLPQLPKNMKPLPYLDPIKLAKLYQTADALIFPSRLEGFGLVVAEAMAAGLPVIVANSSALTELVKHGKTGFLCAKDDIDFFITAIYQLYQDPMLKCEIAHNARLYVEQNFNIDIMVENYVKIYKKMLITNS